MKLNNLMYKTLVVTLLVLMPLCVSAQENVMKIKKTDGTISQTRVADLQQISFLSQHRSIEFFFLVRNGSLSKIH